MPQTPDEAELLRRLKLAHKPCVRSRLSSPRPPLTKGSYGLLHSSHDRLRGIDGIPSGITEDAIHAFYEYTYKQEPLRVIAERYGTRHKSTVMRRIRKVADNLDEYPVLREAVEMLYPDTKGRL